MKLAEKIIKNQQAGQLVKNEELIKIKLKELVFDYTDEVLEVLHKTGIAVSRVLPDDVILTVVVKHLPKNPQLREAISHMILELDEQYNADGENKGQGLAIIGGALSAVGTVLAGIGRGQFQNTDAQLQQQQYYMQMQQQQQMEQDRKRRTTWIIIGISAFAILGAMLAFRAAGKAGKVEAVPA